MKLWLTRRHWEKFARTDPMWAVLTVPGKARNRWDVDEFFLTGRHDVDASLDHVHAHYPQLRRGRALDFGCGVGRLTQALALHFDAVTGVDISAPMLEHARAHNRHGERVSYVHNTRPDLAVFGSGSFDFVYSLITLQHIAPEYSRRYIAEFVRLLAPGGAALFQVPYHAPPAARDEQVKFSTWPPTLLKRVARVTYRRLRRFYRHWFGREPVMEMHTLPREEVLAIVRGAGAEVLDVQPHGGGGNDYASYAYLIRKP